MAHWRVPAAYSTASVPHQHAIAARLHAPYRAASYVYVTPHPLLVQLRRHRRRLLLLRDERLVHVAAVLQTDVRVVGGARHRHERT